MKLLLILLYWNFIVQTAEFLPAKQSNLDIIQKVSADHLIFTNKNIKYNRRLDYEKHINYYSQKNTKDANLTKNDISISHVNFTNLYRDLRKDFFYLSNNSNDTIINFRRDDNNKFWVNLIICAFCLIMIIATLVGNTLVILAVTIVRKLHTEDNANNYLIVSLAISDLLVGVLVMPFALHVEIKEDHKWTMTAILCDLWTLFDVLLCTASILNLVAISIDRYFIILHAMVYTQRRNAKLMILMIVSVWILSALISIPPLFGWGRASNNLQKIGICLVSQDFRYQIYATLLAFYIPLLVMIIIYINIYRAAKKIKKKELETCGRLKAEMYPHNNVVLNHESTCTKPIQSETSNQPAKCNIDLQQPNNKLLSASPLSLTNNIAPNGNTSCIYNKNIEQSTYYNLQLSKTKHSGSLSESSNRSIDSRMYSSSMSSQENNGITNSTFNVSNFSFRNRQPSFRARLTRRLTNVFSGIKRHSSIATSHGKNQKATQTLGIIMGCFILCWLPFFIVAIVKPIPLQNGTTIRDFIPGWLDSFLLWLGYFNSALNPIIYARFNREFRRPFIEILCFRCRGINEKLRDEERKKIYLDANLLNTSMPFNNIYVRTSACSTTGVQSNYERNSIKRVNVETVHVHEDGESIGDEINKGSGDNKSHMSLKPSKLSFSPNDSLNTEDYSKNSDLGKKLSSMTVQIKKDDIKTCYNKDMKNNVGNTQDVNSIKDQNIVLNNEEKSEEEFGFLSEINRNGISDDKISSKNDKSYKLNELLSSRFYNLAMIGGIETSKDFSKVNQIPFQNACDVKTYKDLKEKTKKIKQEKKFDQKPFAEEQLFKNPIKMSNEKDNYFKKIDKETGNFPLYLKRVSEKIHLKEMKLPQKNSNLLNFNKFLCNQNSVDDFAKQKTNNKLINYSFSSNDLISCPKCSLNVSESINYERSFSCQRCSGFLQD